MKNLPKINKEHAEERRKKIIQLSNTGSKRQEILEVMILTNWPITQAIVDRELRDYRALQDSDNFETKKLKTLERSKQRLQDENNYLRKQVRQENRGRNGKENYEELFTRLVKTEVKPVKFNSKIIKKEQDWKYFSTTDWHIGKQNTHLILEKIDIIIKDILKSKEKSITLAMLGDLWENISQNPMHSGQHLNMDYLTLEENFDITKKIFFGIIDKITKKKYLELILIGGNHDRLTSKNDDDYLRSGMFMLAEVLKARYSENKNFNLAYNTKNRVILEKEDLVLDLGHGEFNFNKDKLQTIRHKTGLSSVKHIVRNSGHRHAAFLENARDVTRIITPALAGVGDYDSRLDLNSNTGYTKISIEDKRLNIQTIFFN